MTEVAEAAGGGARTLECPGCGLVREVDRFQRTAGEFCARCDYPLFFAPAATTRRTIGADERSDVERALRRLPGDRHRLLTESCPACGERNPAGNVTCLRCGALLHPPAVPPELAAADPVSTETTPVVVPLPRRVLDPALVAVLVIVVLVLGLVLAAVRT